MSWIAALVLASVQVSAERCERLDVAEVQRIVEVELTNAPPTTEPIVAKLTCNGTAVQTEVADPITRKTLARTVSVKGLGARGPARALALAIAELISASWSELLLTPRPPKPDDERAERPEPTPEVVQQAVATLPAVTPRDTLRLEALGSMRVLPGSDAVQWGGGARFVWASTARLGVLVDVVIDHTEVTRPLGRLSIDSVSASAGPVVVFKPAAWLHLLAAVVGRFGAGRLVGTANDAVLVAGGTVSGAWGGPAIAAGAGVRLGPFALGLAAEGGWSLVKLSATADGARVAGIDGAWVGVSLSVGWAR